MVLIVPYPVPLPGSVKARLLSAGREHFQAVGFDAAAVGEIAAAAGVTTGALYHHFGSKLGLFTVLREEFERRMTERLAGAAAAVGAGRTGLVAGLGVTFDAAVRFGATRILATRILAGPDPGGAPDLFAASAVEVTGLDAVQVRCAVAAWRAALSAVADGTDPAQARAALLWVLAGA